MLHRLRRWPGGMLQDVVAALFPASCRRCGRSLPRCESAPRSLRPYAPLFAGGLRRRVGGSLSIPLYVLCPECTGALRRVPRTTLPVATEAGWRCLSAFEPEPSLFTLVHALKYEGLHELAPWLAAFMAAALRRHERHTPNGSVLVPVPLHPQREAERGFNQSALLAAAVGQRLGLPVDTMLLRRRRATRSQARLDPEARRTNVRDAFERRRPLPVGVRILLVDDVVTSGATVHAALLALGCEPAHAAVLCLCHAGGAADSRSTASAAVCDRSSAESSLSGSGLEGRCTSAS